MVCCIATLLSCCGVYQVNGNIYAIIFQSYLLKDSPGKTSSGPTRERPANGVREVGESDRALRRDRWSRGSKCSTPLSMSLSRRFSRSIDSGTVLCVSDAREQISLVRQLRLPIYPNLFFSRHDGQR